MLDAFAVEPNKDADPAEASSPEDARDITEELLPQEERKTPQPHSLKKKKDKNHPVNRSLFRRSGSAKGAPTQSTTSKPLQAATKKVVTENLQKQKLRQKKKEEHS